MSDLQLDEYHSTMEEEQILERKAHQDMERGRIQKGCGITICCSKDNTGLEKYGNHHRL